MVQGRGRITIGLGLDLKLCELIVLTYDIEILHVLGPRPVVQSLPENDMSPCAKLVVVCIIPGTW